MLELLQQFNPLKRLKNQTKESDSSKIDLRKKTEGILMTDRLSDELKEIVETASGCGFIAILRVLRLLDAPILKSREKQEKLISSFKAMFGSLTAEMTPVDIAKFFEEQDLGVHISAFHFNENLGDDKKIQDHFSSKGDLPIHFTVSRFTSSDQIYLEEGQAGMIGVEKADEGHYIASDETDFLSRTNPGGPAELRAYLKQGYHVTEIIVFEKNKEQIKNLSG